MSGCSVKRDDRRLFVSIPGSLCVGYLDLFRNEVAQEANGQAESVRLDSRSLAEPTPLQ